MKKLNFSLFLFIMAMQLFAQTYQPYIFKTVPFGGGGCVSGIITCPTQQNLIFARTDVGGAFRWVESEKGWKSLSFAISHPGLLSVESLAIDPLSPNRVYCVAGEGYYESGFTGLMRSTDYGDSWEVIDVSSKFKALGNSGPQKGSGERLMVDPNLGSILYFGSRSTGLWKSTDYGSTWNKVTTFPMTSNTIGNGILFVDFLPEFSPKGQATMALYAGISRTDMVAPLDSANIYLSIDYGVTWNPISAQKGNGSVTPPANYVLQHSVYAGGKIYVTYGTAPKACVWRYDVVNEMWEDVSPAETVPFSGVTVDNKTSPTIIAMTTNAIFSTAQTWISGTTSWGDDVIKGTIDASGKITWGKRLLANSLVKYDTNATIQNGGMHWSWDIEIDPFNKNRVFVNSGNGVYTTDNFNAINSTWYANVKNLEETITMDVASVPGGKFLLALGDISGGVYSDFSQPCIRYNPSQAITSSVDYSPTTKMLIRAGSNRVANGVAGSVMYSDQDGVLWTGVPQDKMPLNPALPATLTSADATPVYGTNAISADGTTIAWSTSWEVSSVVYYGNFYTMDKGLTWKVFTYSDNINTRVVADKVAPNTFYFCTGTSIYVYTWNGKSYDFKQNNTPLAINTLILGNPLVQGEFLGFASTNGLYLFTNYGAQYTKLTQIPTCGGAGWGKPAPGRTNPTIFAYGKSVNETTYNQAYRSDDYGTTWYRLTNEKSQFGGIISRGLIRGDMNVYGRYYFGNSGIGLIYGDIDTSSKVQPAFASNASLAKIGNNPFNETFNVLTDKDLDYRILNIAGSTLSSGKIQGSVALGNNLKPGIYLLELKDKRTKEIQINKLIKN